jgi:hypothetical protein
VINWKLLYDKFGRLNAAKKFEDLALDYVCDVYNEYTWKPTQRTRDGNRDFHNLEEDLLKIWGEAKYKKDSISLTRKDLDPTILSGLIDGHVELIIFVTNGKIPEELISRMTLGANMKGIKLSFVTGKQLSDWLVLNPEKYKIYFGEELEIDNYKVEQLIEFRKISFYEPISLDFRPNFNKVCMNIEDTFILNCIFYNSQPGNCSIELEDDAPLSFIKSDKYENPECFFVKPGLNSVSFLIRAMKEYNKVLRITLICDHNKYHCISEKLVIKRNKQLNIYYFKQINILSGIKTVLDYFDNTIGNYAFFIHGNSGMGKSYILKSLSLDYCLNNDLTLVTFESEEKSNVNYLLICRIIIFLQYGNIFWDYKPEKIKDFCNSNSNFNIETDKKILNDILNGCFDSNIAKTVIEKLQSNFPNKYNFISSVHPKSFRVLLLDDIHNLNKTQSTLLYNLINELLASKSKTILVLAGRKKEFKTPAFEKKLLDTISNYYELDKLSEKDIKGTIQQNFNVGTTGINGFVNSLPSNLLLLNEILSNFKYSYQYNKEVSISKFIDKYINLYKEDLVFQEKFLKLKDKYYLLDILYLFKKGLRAALLYEYSGFDKKNTKNDIQILIENNCIIQIGTALLVPFHDYMISNYKKLRKGKEYNKKTGDFLVFLLNKTQNDMDTNYLLSLICKCGKTYFNYYNKSIKNLMLKYIHQSEYGTAVYFAEIFYDNISNKKKLTANEKHFLYLYADCLVHCDNQYRAKQFFQEILTKEENTSFEKYEVAVSLLNQRFWNIDLDELIEDSKMYQYTLESLFMDHLKPELIWRFRKTYESCFNRRMVTQLLIDEYKDAQISYSDGLIAIKKLSEKYNLNFQVEIATIIMDYARGNMSIRPKMSYRLFNISKQYFSKAKSENIRRFVICQIDLFVMQNILKENVDYIDFMNKVNILNEHNFLQEYVKGKLKFFACRMVDFGRINGDSRISVSFMTECINEIEKIKLNNYISLQGRERYLYNYILCYFYIIQNQYENAKAAIIENLAYVKEAGATYKIPLEHNLANLETIRRVEWFQNQCNYPENVYLLDSRFW